MSRHPNARLTPRGRETLVSRIESGGPVGAVAAQMGVSRQTASKWVARARHGEPMSDRGSRPRRSGDSRGPGRLHRALQLGEAAQHLRGPAPDVTRDRVGNVGVRA